MVWSYMWNLKTDKQKNNQTLRKQDQIYGYQRWGMGGVDQMVEGGQKLETSSYK